MDAPIYLYAGPEAGERDDAVAQVKAAMRKKFGETDEHLFYATETPVAQVVTLLQSGSLFASASCVTLRCAEAVKKKEDAQMIADWAKNPGDGSAALILVSDEISIDSKIDKAVPPSHKKIFWEMFEDRKIPWLSAFFKKNGYSVSEEAAEDILDMIENNTQALKSECSRFFMLFPAGREISCADVEAVLAPNREENAFTLFDTMASVAPVFHKLEKSLEALQKIRLSKENSSVALIAGLSSCFRRLEAWHELVETGRNDDFNLKANGFASKKAKAQYSRASQIWSRGQAASILAQLACADMEIRSGGAPMEDTILQRTIYEIVAKKGAPCAAYRADA